MPEVPISQPLAAPLRTEPTSIWDEDCNQFEEEPFEDYLGYPCLEEGPLTDAQVKALTASRDVARPEPSSGTATPIMPTSEASRGVGGTGSPSESLSDSSACPELLATSDLETAPAPAGNRKRD